MNTWEYVLFVYFGLAFLKFGLCAYHLPAAIGAMSRLHGARKGQIRPLFVLVVPLTLAGTSLVMWPVTLFKEGVQFFSFYSRFAVLRTCVRAHRDSFV